LSATGSTPTRVRRSVVDGDNKVASRPVRVGASTTVRNHRRLAGRRAGDCQWPTTGAPRNDGGTSNRPNARAKDIRNAGDIATPREAPHLQGCTRALTSVSPILLHTPNCHARPHLY
jgi:hypothetical protein